MIFDSQYCRTHSAPFFGQMRDPTFKTGHMEGPLGGSHCRRNFERGKGARGMLGVEATAWVALENTLWSKGVYFETGFKTNNFGGGGSMDKTMSGGNTTEKIPKKKHCTRILNGRV